MVFQGVEPFLLSRLDNCLSHAEEGDLGSELLAHRGTPGGRTSAEDSIHECIFALSSVMLMGIASPCVIIIASLL
jgi:hypothetical protein